jgi:hypothetical protein
MRILSFSLNKTLTNVNQVRFFVLIFVRFCTVRQPSKDIIAESLDLITLIVLLRTYREKFSNVYYRSYRLKSH